VGEATNLNVPDVRKEENYLECADDVESELVTLIRAGDDVFGLINIESEESGAFGDDDETSLQSVTDKLAEQLAAERR
jgi:putative methionine-R-sulfoxide reductase with GAF domain